MKKELKLASDVAYPAYMDERIEIRGNPVHYARMITFQVQEGNYGRALAPHANALAERLK